MKLKEKLKKIEKDKKNKEIANYAKSYNRVFEEEIAAAYANPNHKGCLGRGFYIIQFPVQQGIWAEEKRYCECVYRNLEKLNTSADGVVSNV